MRISNEDADAPVLAELGARLRALRLERNLSQQKIATEAGVGRMTVQRLEEGESASLTSLIRVLRALGALGDFDLLLPPPPPSPIDELRRQGRGRKRAGATRAAAEPKTGTWQWGDEAKDA
jgi:transcriptional regulator with XRE-family HTH domain